MTNIRPNRKSCYKWTDRSGNLDSCLPNSTHRYEHDLIINTLHHFMFLSKHNKCYSHYFMLHQIQKGQCMHKVSNECKN